MIAPNRGSTPARPRDARWAQPLQRRGTAAHVPSSLPASIPASRRFNNRTVPYNIVQPPFAARDLTRTIPRATTERRYAHNEAGQHRERQEPGRGAPVGGVDVPYRCLVVRHRHEVDEAEERQSPNGDEQVVAGTSRPWRLGRSLAG
jgi:hypothetical protein